LTGEENELSKFPMIMPLCGEKKNTRTYRHVTLRVLTNIVNDNNNNNNNNNNNEYEKLKAAP
jgi:hypothetical protein